MITCRQKGRGQDRQGGGIRDERLAQPSGLQNYHYGHAGPVPQHELGSKKFVDQVAHKIYMLQPNKAEGIQFALFATVEHESSSEAAMSNMEDFVLTCHGVVIRKLALHNQLTQEEFEEAVDSFSGILAILAK